MRRILLGVLLVLGAAAAAPAAAAPPDVIRTGGPSGTADRKVAVVGSATDRLGATFQVLRADGTVARTGTLTRAPGSAAPWAYALRADWSAVTAPGTYRIAVGALRSRPWTVSGTATEAPIRAMLRFFAVQNDGNEPSPLHDPSHLNDGRIAAGKYAGRTFDLTGGWMDAGNQVKFVQTTAHAAALLQAAARMDPALAAPLNATADVGIRWLRKAHPVSDLFVVQVGDQRDSDAGFRDPADDDASSEPGIGVRAAYPQAGADQAGKAAAALALAADRSTGTVRSGRLAAARQWYAFGRAHPSPGAELDGFYYSDTIADDMAAGAAALYRTTGEAHFLDEALAYLDDAGAGVGWDSVGSFAAADLCGVLGAPGAADPTARAAACDALGDHARAGATFAGQNAFGTPAPFDAFGHTAENASAGALAALAARAGRLAAGRGVAAGARDFMLGRNQWGAGFVVGYGAGGGARNPHHWARALIGPGRPVGAVVGGPSTAAIVSGEGLALDPNGAYKPFNSTRVYEDDLDDYVTSEPALDYTATSIFLLAALGAP
ncbi:MAG TPA: glycoside hydrolase family 9 protein [Solirubrobacteraceae bacterium]